MMSSDLIIRSAVPGDGPQLAALSRVLGYPVEDEALTRRLGSLLQRPEDVVLVAEAPPGRVVGWLHGAEQEVLEAGRRCEILGLVVDAAYRGRGAGRRLVAALEEWAGKRELRLISVRSNVVRTEAHPFYEGVGFVRVKTQHAYHKPLAGQGAGERP